MPNKPSVHKKSVTISINKKLVAKIDRIADLTNRSRTYVIEQLLCFQIKDYEKTEEADKHVLTAAKKDLK
jgi:predicted transcriptional regulator